MSRLAGSIHSAGVLLALVAILSACTPVATGTPSPASGSTTVVASPDPVDTGDVKGFTTTTITFGGQDLIVAVADDSSRRSQGLRGVERFGDLAGMLFRFEGPVTTVFTMQDTPTPLDLLLLDADGVILEILAMDPCSGPDCRFPPTVAYHYALEIPRGSLDASVGDRFDLP